METGVGGYTIIPGSTFDQCFVAKDRDTLIEQSLTLISSNVYFFLKLYTQF